MAWVLGLSSLLASGANAGSITLSDGEFDEASWSIELFGFHTGGTATASQATESGNPGAHRRVDHATNTATDPADNAAIYAFHGYVPGIVDPGAVGAITGVDFSWDARVVEGGGVFTGPALSQGGRFYVSAGLLELLGSDTQWRTIERLDVVGANFGLIRDILEIDPAQDPDFSASGEPITFGFFSALAGGLGGPGIMGSAGFDNWRVEVRTAPEPSAAILLGLVAALTLSRRRI